MIASFMRVFQDRNPLRHVKLFQGFCRFKIVLLVRALSIVNVLDDADLDLLGRPNNLGFFIKLRAHDTLLEKAFSFVDDCAEIAVLLLQRISTVAIQIRMLTQLAFAYVCRVQHFEEKNFEITQTI